MAGPGGPIVGRVSVKVVPDTSGFKRQLERELAADKLNEIKIKVKPDFKKFDEQVKQELARQKNKDLDVVVGAEIKKFAATVETARKAASAKPVQIPISPLEKAFVADVRKTVAEVSRTIAVNVPLDADGEQLVRDAKVLIKEIEAGLNPIEVPLDAGAAAKLRAETLAKVEALQLLVDTNPVEVPVTVNNKGIQRFRLDLRKLTSSLGGLLKPFDKATGKLGIFGRELSKLRGAARNTSPALLGLGLTFATILPQALSLTASLGTLVGAVNLLPAGLFAVAGAGGVAAVALIGFGDALGSVGSSPQEFANTLENVAPAARETLKAIRALIEPMKELQQALQQALFANTARSVTALGQTILALQPALVDISAALGQVFRDFAAVFTTREAIGQLRDILGETARTVANLSPGIAAFAGALINVGQVGAPYISGLALNLSDLLRRFESFTERAAADGTLDSWIGKAIAGFRDLGSVLKSVYQIFSGIAQAAQNAGGSTLGSLAVQLREIAVVVNGPAFQTGLTTIFKGLDELGSNLAKGFAPVGDAIAALAPSIRLFLATLGEVGGTALTALGNALVALAPQINALAVAVLPKVVDLFHLLLPVVVQVATAIANNTPLFLALAAAFVAFIAPVTAGIAVIALLVANFQSIVTFLQPVIAYVQSFIPLFVAFGASIKTSLAQAAPIIQQIAQLFITNWPQIRTIVVQVMSTIRSVVALTLTIVAVQFRAAVTTIRAIWAVLGPITRGAFQGMLTVIRGALNVIQGVVRLFTAALKGDFSGMGRALLQIVKGMWQAIKGTFQAAQGALAAIARGIIEAVKAQFAGLATTLYRIGSQAIQGLINGIRDRVGDVGEAVSGIAGNITGKLSSLLRIKSPSRVMRTLGRYVTQGFADGIVGTAKQVTRAARTLKNKLQDALRQKKITKSQYRDALEVLTRETDRLYDLAKARKKLAKDLEIAKKNLTEAIQERASFRDSVKQSIKTFTNITAGIPTDGTLNSKKLIANLKARRLAVADYNKTLLKLRKLGLNKSTFAQLLEAGVETGGETARALLAGGRSAVTQVNRLQKDIDATAGNLASKSAHYLYDAGVAAAKGLVDGLLKIDLTKATRRISRELIAALKRELKIKSPSKLTRDEIGVPTGEGIVEGVLATRKSVNRAINGLVQVTQTKAKDATADSKRATVNIENMYAVDPTEAARKIELRQRDAYAVYSLGGVV